MTPPHGSGHSGDGRAGPDRAPLVALLTEQRDGVLVQLSDLSADLAGLIAAGESVATDDEHDPEGTTIAFERAQLASLIETAQARAAELGEAIARAASGDYGLCQSCGQPIGAERLAARPEATACITCATRRGR
ncbi:MAG: DnaK suppressor protein [Cryptosporangiaceae bacterium]|nr:DnaK suppressor protein [Cryptosporangiaceae bacterium]